MANIRSAYAEVTANQLTGEGSTSKDVTLTQTKAGWTETPNWPENLDMQYTPVAGDNGTVTVTYNTSTGKCVVAKKTSGGNAGGSGNTTGGNDQTQSGSSDNTSGD